MLLNKKSVKVNVSSEISGVSGTWKEILEWCLTSDCARRATVRGVGRSEELPLRLSSKASASCHDLGEPDQSRGRHGRLARSPRGGIVQRRDHVTTCHRLGDHAYRARKSFRYDLGGCRGEEYGHTPSLR